MTGLSIPHEQVFCSRQFHQLLLKGTLFSPHIVLANLMYITGNGNYSHLVMANGQKDLCSRAVSFYEEHLSKCSDSFLRVHKQCLINVLHVKKCTSNQLIMIDGYAVPIARRRKKEVKLRMKMLLQKNR
jgi:DNA-binding LytR/AlgR family response regulator